MGDPEDAGRNPRWSCGCAARPCFAGASIERLPTLVSDEAAPGRLQSVHGTCRVASVVFGQHQGPVAGISARLSRPDPVPVFREDRRGHLSQLLDLDQAIEQAVEAGAPMPINVSGRECAPSPRTPTMRLSARSAFADRRRSSRRHSRRQ